MFWREMMEINVILSIDERIEDIKRCVASLRKVYPAVRIGLATYGGILIADQPIVKEYAREQGFIYFSAQRQTWLTEDDSREWQCSETLGRIQITKHFMDIGFDEIYTMHSDAVIVGDFRKHYLNKAVGNWSFIALLVRAADLFETLCERGSWGLWFDENPARLADVVTRYNPEFVKKIYEMFLDDREIWDKWLSKYALWGDLTQFDIARNCFGFNAAYFTDKTDLSPLCFNTIHHIARQSVPACLSDGTKKGLDRDWVMRNYLRRVKCAT